MPLPIGLGHRLLPPQAEPHCAAARHAFDGPASTQSRAKPQGRPQPRPLSRRRRCQPRAQERQCSLCDSFPGPFLTRQHSGHLRRSYPRSKWLTQNIGQKNQFSCPNRTQLTLIGRYPRRSPPTSPAVSRSALRAVRGGRLRASLSHYLLNSLIGCGSRNDSTVGTAMSLSRWRRCTQRT
jgi:hypothetical protein